ncbi:hypothetical protein MAR_008601 [Mya arenaria]|uniref:Uncharacterized protein n=1 Tax=Mya arenaria TaxID=6604 RepID=A0ABY7DWE3_MYAAR|nr:hypothetical protein MAR_008601 [Mya arenaria]
MGLETTSPGTTRNIDYVDVTIGQHTDVNCLNGFKLWNPSSLPSLEAGNEIDAACRRSLNDLWSRFRFLLRSLGFKRLNERSPLQWERPVSGFREEFDSLCIVFRGLFRPVNDFPVLEPGCHL